jgi:hypothetical protein
MRAQCGEFKSDNTGQCTNPAWWEVTNPEAPGPVFHSCGLHLNAACFSAQYGDSGDELIVRRHWHDC